MATENVTPADPPAYAFTLAGELRKLARHAEDALAMLREHEVSTDRRQSIEQAVRELVGAIEDYASSAPRRVVATVQPARRGDHG